MKQNSSMSFLTIFSNNTNSPIWESIQIKPDHDTLIYQGQLYTFTGTVWLLEHFELYPDILVRDSDELLCIELYSVLLKRLKPTDIIGAFKYGLSFTRGNQKVQLFSENVESFNIWHDHLKRLCIIPSFNKRHKLIAKVKNSNNYFDCYKFINGLQFQVRIVEKQQIQNMQQLNRELRVLRSVNHKSVQKLLEVYEDGQAIYMLFDTFLGHSLKSRIYEFYNLQEKQLAEFCFKLINALSHIHSKNIIHKDIRPENIILPHVKFIMNPIIANFASAEFKLKQKKKKVFCPGFMAPELFHNRNYDEKIDVFALGIIFYAFLYQKYPFEGKDFRETQLLNEKCQLQFDTQNKWSASAIDLLQNMLQKDPKLRCSSNQALKHHWFINQRLRECSRNLGHPSLSTIIEKSEFDQSQQHDRSRTISRFRNQTQDSRYRMKSMESLFNIDFLNSDQDHFTSVSQKIQQLNQFSGFTPSKQAHG